MIYFYNPHVDDLLGILPYFKLRGRRSVSKYHFVAQRICQDIGEMNVIIDHTCCSFLPHYILEKIPFIFRIIICEIDFFIWKKFNREFKIKRRRRLSSDYKNIKILAFLWRNLESDKFGIRSAKTLNQFELCILHCSHYFLNAKNKGNNSKYIKNKCFAGDNEFYNNDFFKNHFCGKKENFLVLPFCVDQRFSSLDTFESRIDQCIATGTVIEISNEINQGRHFDFMQFFNLKTYHVGRLKLYKKRLVLKKFKIFQAPMRSVKKSDTGIINTFLRLSNKQRNYFSVDMVAMYNKYKFAYVGEEITGACALGNFEAMACGCVVLGQRGYFGGTGLVPGVHFVEIEGDFDTFINEFEVGMLNGIPIEDIPCEQIAHNGKVFVNENYREADVFERWMQQINGFDACVGVENERMSNL